MASSIARPDFDSTVEATDVNLIPASWRNFLQALHHPGAFLQQHPAMPAEVAQLTDLWRRHE